MDRGRCQMHIGAQTVHHQALHRAVGISLGQVQQQVGAGVGDKEIDKIFALRCQKRRPDQPRGLGEVQHIIADQPLQKGQGVIAGQFDHAALDRYGHRCLPWHTYSRAGTGQKT